MVREREKVILSSNFIESRPQRLCLMCGKCCRLATTYLTYNELLKLAEENDEGAKEFLRVFEPYPSIAAAKDAHPDIAENILVNLERTDNDSNEITFYKCKYIKDDNLCGIYENRPELCERFPSSPWAVVPPGCGYEGYLFQAKEKIKQNIRKLKENLLEYEAELKTEQNPERKLKLESAIEKTKNIVAHYAKYGSEDW